MLGVALMGAGFMVNASRKRKSLYRGTITPGSETRIIVFRGDTVLHDQTNGG